MEVFLAAFVYGSVIIAALALLCVDRIESANVPILIAVVLTPLGFMRTPDIFFVTFVEVMVLLFIPALLIRDSSIIVRQRIPWPLILLFVFYLVRLLVDLAFTSEQLVVYLRDARIVTGFLAVVFLGELMRMHFGLNRTFLVKLCLFAVGVDILYFWFGKNIGVNPSGIVEELLFRADVLRYQDDFSIVLFGFLNYVVFIPGRMSRRLLAASLMAVIAALSLNRVFFGFSAFAGIFLFWEIIGRYAGSKFLGALIMTSILVLSVVAGEGYLRAISSEEGEVALRFLELLDWKLLLAGLQLRFVDPALAGGYELSWLTGIIGMGPSFKFFIPWFDYRGLDPNHSSVDSLYIFTFVKFGLVGFVLTVMAVRHCLWQGGQSFMNAWVWVYLLVHNGMGAVPFLFFLFLSLLSKPFIRINVLDRSSLIRERKGSFMKRISQAKKGNNSDVPSEVRAEALR